MKQNRDLVAVGDRVFFWRSGTDAALTAVGHVISPVYERESQFGSFAVDVRFDQNVDPVLRRDEILKIPELSDVAVFQGWQGTNFRLQPKHVRALDGLLHGRLMEIARANAIETYDSFSELSEAINRGNQRVKAELRDLVRNIDPRTFEFLVRRVLIALGYRDVTVTRYSGDKGIDATAIFDVGGATPVNIAIQAKRTGTVDRPTVQNVRGSLTNRELGLIVTSGTFTASAKTEAQEPGKAPIGLIDGAKLLEIMVANRIGVEEKTFPALRLVPDALSLDNLTSDVQVDE
jgi:HJR/Mrr/RecB family endonuclease